jgi:hypothetical protein
MSSEHAVTTVPPEAWDDLVRAFPRRTVFHTRAWLETLAVVHGVEIVLARADRDGRCEGVWPCLLQRKGPFRILGSPLPGWNTAYLGPLLADGARGLDVVRAFLTSPILRRWSYCSCKVLAHDEPIDLGPLGFTRVLTEETYFLDLSLPEETLWSNMKGQCRSRVRKATRAGIEVVEETGDDWREDFWRMSVETFGQDGLAPPFTRPFLDTAAGGLAAAGQVIVLSGRLEGQRIATLVLPHDDRTMYYWGGARYVAHRDVPAHNLLHWEAMRLGRARGLTGYDLINVVGSHGRFKKTFGPRVEPRGDRWEASRSQMVALLKRGYERYLRRRQRRRAA